MLSKELIKSIKKLYLAGYSSPEIKSIIMIKYNLPISSSYIRRILKRNNIKMRELKESIILHYRKKQPIRGIIKLYKQGRPVRELSRTFRIGRKTINKILEENNIRILGSRAALIRIGYIKEKKRFKITPKEKAYLFGLVMGDLTPVKKSNYTLKLITHTTHPAFVQLLKKSFAKYGPFSSIINKNNEFRCSIYLDLESFSFLLDSKKYKAQKLIIKNAFFDFLGGFIDSDGSIMVKKRGKSFGYYIRFYGENLELLKKLKSKLKKIGYSTSIHKNHSKGEISNHNGRKFKYNEDYYALEIYKKQEVVNLLKILPIRHKERILKKELIFNIEKRGLNSWLEIEEEVLSLRKSIKEDVKNRFISRYRLE